MFLFLSKLLPTLIYPVGLSCLLMLVALITLWKRPRIAAIALTFALVYLLIGSSGLSTDFLVKSLEWRNIPNGDLPKADAIVVLGGSTRSASPPRPWIELSEEGDRILYAAKLYRDGKAPKVIVSGGRIEWMMGGEPESSDMAVLLTAMGIPKTAILEDPTSQNTYENAVNVKKILETEKLQKILLVTSAMHMPRSLLIFKHLGIDTIAAPTDFLVTQQDIKEEQETSKGRILGLLPNADSVRNFSRALKEYIGIAVYWLRGWI
jgi:uncharacterized SAM-binding protein YcdF (DUF218 family)